MTSIVSLGLLYFDEYVMAATSGVIAIVSFFVCLICDTIEKTASNEFEKSLDDDWLKAQIAVHNMPVKYKPLTEGNIKSQVKGRGDMPKPSTRPPAPNPSDIGRHYE